MSVKFNLSNISTELPTGFMCKKKKKKKKVLLSLSPLIGVLLLLTPAVEQQSSNRAEFPQLANELGTGSELNLMFILC